MVENHGGANALEENNAGKKPAMPLTEAKKLFAVSHRWTLSDSTFGDAEVGWRKTKGGEELATGYFGRSSYVSLRETADYAATTFKGDDAHELRAVTPRTTEWFSNND